MKDIITRGGLIIANGLIAYFTPLYLVLLSCLILVVIEIITNYMISFEDRKETPSKIFKRYFIYILIITFFHGVSIISQNPIIDSVTFTILCTDIVFKIIYKFKILTGIDLAPVKDMIK